MRCRVERRWGGTRRSARLGKEPCAVRFARAPYCPGRPSSGYFKGLCTAQDRHTSATFFFPPELGLPSLHVLTSTPEGPSVDRPPAVPVAAMLSVPTACDEDPDQNEAPSMPPQLHLLQKAMAEHCDAVTALRKREREEDSFRSPNDSLVGDNDLAAAVAPPVRFVRTPSCQTSR